MKNLSDQRGFQLENLTASKAAAQLYMDDRISVAKFMNLMQRIWEEVHPQTSLSRRRALAFIKRNTPVEPIDDIKQMHMSGFTVEEIQRASSLAKHL